MPAGERSVFRALSRGVRDAPGLCAGGEPTMDPPIAEDESTNNHLLWFRARMLVDDQFLDVIRHGFSLIVAGFGSFSLFQGLTIGERHVSPLPKTFALIVTAIGVIVILLALWHAARMTTWVNADAFGD